MGTQQTTAARPDATDGSARNTADADGRPREFRRQFVVGARDYGEGFDHDANRAGTAQEAVFVGWRPSGEPRLVGEESHADGRHIVLTYAVAVSPASASEAGREPQS